MKPPTLFLTRRSAERAAEGHILSEGFKAARAFIKQVQKGFMRMDHGWEVTISPGDGRKAYPLVA